MGKHGIYIILALVSSMVIAGLIYRHAGYKICPNCTAHTYFQRGLEYACQKDRDYRLTALNFLEKAAEKGDFDARLILAELYLQKFPQGYVQTFPEQEACLDQEVTPDRKTAMSYFQQVIKDIEAGKDVPPALYFNIYLLYASDILPGGHSAEAAQGWLQRAADSGNGAAVVLLAKAADARGNYEQARKWLEKAWNSHADWKSALTLGDYYFYGRGTDVNYQKAEQWYERALEAAQKLSAKQRPGEDRAEIEDACRIRLDIVRQRLAAEKGLKRETLKYRLEGRLNENIVYVEGGSGKLEPAGKVIRKDGKIIAALNDKIKYAVQPDTMKKEGFSSMLEGVKWVLNTYAHHASKENNAKEFDFVLAPW